MGLAERLNVVTTYLADLKQQCGDAPGISMVSDVLSQLAQRQAPAAPHRPAARPPRPPCLWGNPTRADGYQGVAQQQRGAARTTQSSWRKV